MGKFIVFAFIGCSLIFLSTSCQQEENASPVNDAESDVVKIATDLSIHLQYPATEAYDSACIVFKNATSVVRYKLTLNDEHHVATGHVSIPSGNWNISTSYFSTVVKDYESLEKNGVVSLEITPTATDLISTEAFVFIEENADPITLKSFRWTGYYYYHLYLDNKLEGFVRLPQDPINPFIEISTFNPGWIYAYADRTFYNTAPDGSSHWYQGGGAFEVYDDVAAIIDSTSLKPGISGVKNKTWNYVDCLVMVHDTKNNELTVYHNWDLRASFDGRIKSGLRQVDWRKTKIIDDRKRRMNLIH